MKKLTLNFLIVLALSLWIGGEVAVRNQIMSDIDLKAYNKLYREVLDKPEQKLALHHTFSRMLLHHLYFPNKEIEKKEVQLAGMVEMYVAYEKFIHREKPSISTCPTWKAAVVNFYLLTAQEREILFDYLKALETKPPVKMIY